LLISVVCSLIIEPTLRHITAAYNNEYSEFTSFGSDLQSNVVRETLILVARLREF